MKISVRLECLVVTLSYLSLSFGKSQSGKVEMACGSVIVRFGLYSLVFLFLLFCWEFYAMKTLGLSIFHFHVLIFFSCLVSIPLYRVIKSLFLFCDSHFVCFFFTLCIFTGLTLFGFVLISFSCVLLPWYFHC